MSGHALSVFENGARFTGVPSFLHGAHSVSLVARARSVSDILHSVKHVLSAMQWRSLNILSRNALCQWRRCDGASTGRVNQCQSPNVTERVLWVTECDLSVLEQAL